MLKLTASYAKKVPASQEYSSQHYHAGVEIEIPDNLPPEELRRRIQGTFALVRESVEAELQGEGRECEENYKGAFSERPEHEEDTRGGYSNQRTASRSDNRSERRNENRANGRAGTSISSATSASRDPDLRRQQGESVRSVSPKQVKYLTDLAARNGYDLATLDLVAEDRYGVATVRELSKHQASKLIDSLSARPDRRAA